MEAICKAGERVIAPVLSSVKGEIVNILVHSFFGYKGGNLGHILSTTPLRYYKRKPLVQAKMNVLGYVLYILTGCLQ